jgi:hypothetical protein
VTTGLSNSTLNVVLSCESDKYFSFQFCALHSAPQQNELETGALIGHGILALCAAEKQTVLDHGAYRNGQVFFPWRFMFL